jgi:hypothetical protein
MSSRKTSKALNVKPGIRTAMVMFLALIPWFPNPANPSRSNVLLGDWMVFSIEVAGKPH